MRHYQVFFLFFVIETLKRLFSIEWIILSIDEGIDNKIFAKKRYWNKLNIKSMYKLCRNTNGMQLYFK